MNFEEKWTAFTEAEPRLYTTIDKRLAAQFWEFGKAEMKASAEKIAADAREEARKIP